MPKTNLSQIFKNGTNFKLREIDWSSPEWQQTLEAVKKEQEACLRRKHVDWAKLNQIYIAI